MGQGKKDPQMKDSEDFAFIALLLFIIVLILLKTKT